MAREGYYVHPDGGRIVAPDEDCPELDEVLSQGNPAKQATEFHKDQAEENLQDKKVGELREMAKEQGVENADDLKKAELVEALKSGE